MESRLFLFFFLLACDGITAQFFNPYYRFNIDRPHVNPEENDSVNEKVNQTKAESHSNDDIKSVPEIQIHYKIYKGFDSAAESVIMKAIDEINKNTVVQFLPKKNRKANLHITSFETGCHGSYGYTRDSYYLNLQESKCVGSVKEVVKDLVRVLEFLHDEKKFKRGKRKAKGPSKVRRNSFVAQNYFDEVTNETDLVGYLSLTDEEGHEDLQMESINQADIEKINRIYSDSEQSSSLENDLVMTEAELANPALSGKREPRYIFQVPGSSTKTVRHQLLGDNGNETASQGDVEEIQTSTFATSSNLTTIGLKHPTSGINFRGTPNVENYKEKTPEDTIVEHVESYNVTQPDALSLVIGTSKNQTIVKGKPDEIADEVKTLGNRTDSGVNFFWDEKYDGGNDSELIVIVRSNSTEEIAAAKNNSHIRYYMYESDSKENSTGREKSAAEMYPVQIGFQHGDITNKSGLGEIVHKVKNYNNTTEYNVDTTPKETPNVQVDPVDIRLMDDDSSGRTNSGKGMNHMTQYAYTTDYTGDIHKSGEFDRKHNPNENFPKKVDTMYKFQPDGSHQVNVDPHYKIDAGEKSVGQITKNQTDSGMAVIEMSNSTDEFAAARNNSEIQYYLYEDDSKSNSTSKEGPNAEMYPVEIKFLGKDSTNKNNSDGDMHKMTHYEYELANRGKNFEKEIINNEIDSNMAVIEMSNSPDKIATAKNNSQIQYYLYEDDSKSNSTSNEEPNVEIYPVEIRFVNKDSTTTKKLRENIDKATNYDYETNSTENVYNTRKSDHKFKSDGNIGNHDSYDGIDFIRMVLETANIPNKTELEDDANEMVYYEDTNRNIRDIYKLSDSYHESETRDSTSHNQKLSHDSGENNVKLENTEYKYRSGKNTQRIGNSNYKPTHRVKYFKSRDRSYAANMEYNILDNSDEDMNEMTRYEYKLDARKEHVEGEITKNQTDSGMAVIEMRNSTDEFVTAQNNSKIQYYLYEDDSKINSTPKEGPNADMYPVEIEFVDKSSTKRNNSGEDMDKITHYEYELNNGKINVEGEMTMNEIDSEIAVIEMSNSTDEFTAARNNSKIHYYLYEDESKSNSTSKEEPNAEMYPIEIKFVKKNSTEIDNSGKDMPNMTRYEYELDAGKEHVKGGITENQTDSGIAVIEMSNSTDEFAAVKNNPQIQYYLYEDDSKSNSTPKKGLNAEMYPVEIKFMNENSTTNIYNTEESDLQLKTDGNFRNQDSYNGPVVLHSILETPNRHNKTESEDVADDTIYYEDLNKNTQDIYQLSDSYHESQTDNSTFHDQKLSHDSGRKAMQLKNIQDNSHSGRNAQKIGDLDSKSIHEVNNSEMEDLGHTTSMKPIILQEMDSNYNSNHKEYSQMIPPSNYKKDRVKNLQRRPISFQPSGNIPMDSPSQVSHSSQNTFITSHPNNEPVPILEEFGAEYFNFIPDSSPITLDVDHSEYQPPEWSKMNLQFARHEPPAPINSQTAYSFVTPGYWSNIMREDQ